MDYEWAPRVVLFVVMVGSGILVIWMARATASGRLKRNDIAGIRIPSTMASDEAWLAAHIRARRPMIYGGIASAASGVLALLPVPMPVVVGGIFVACAAILAFVVYGARVGSKAAVAASTSPRL
jgi:hypothetical protein